MTEQEPVGKFVSITEVLYKQFVDVYRKPIDDSFWGECISAAAKLAYDYSGGVIEYRKLPDGGNKNIVELLAIILHQLHEAGKNDKTTI